MYARQFPSQFSQSNLRALQVTMTFNLRNIIPIGVWIQQIVLPHPVGEVYFPVSLMVRFVMDLIWLKGVVRHDPSKGLKCISALETALMCFCHFCENVILAAQKNGRYTESSTATPHCYHLLPHPLRI